MCVVSFEEFMIARSNLTAAMETLRVYRPRVVLHGAIGMGQGYVAAAAIHHLESFHVQSLDLANLMSDSTRVRTVSYYRSRFQLRYFLFPDNRSRDRSVVRRSKTSSALGDIYSIAVGLVRCRI